MEAHGILDGLSVIAPTSHLFDLEPPKYASSYGQRTQAIFKHAPPAPMVYTPDAGLVLYERVITTHQENQMLDKLSKPKWPRPALKDGEQKGGSSHAAGTASARAASARAPAASSSAPAPTTGAAAPGGAHAGGARTDAAAAAGPGSQQQQHGEPGGPAPLQSRASARGRPRAPLYATDDTLKDYFTKERSSVTATTVFTWGNRYKLTQQGAGSCSSGGGGGGGAQVSGSGPQQFKSHTPSQHKPPLRL